VGVVEERKLHMFNQFAYDCPRCQIGHCHAGTTTYTRVVHGRVVSIPNIAVATCDVCGYQEFDRQALADLQKLLGASSTHTPEDNRPPTKSTGMDVLEKGKSPRPKP
jgi:predicted nucleic-acid-binding Zn-ribbon protein